MCQQREESQFKGRATRHADTSRILQVHATLIILFLNSAMSLFLLSDAVSVVLFVVIQ